MRRHARLWWGSTIALGLLAQVSCSDGGGNGTGSGPGVAVTVTRAGVDVSCGQTEVGTAYCWGANQFGQLGDGTSTDRHVPTLVSGARILTFPSPGDHTCGPEARGLLYCWGRNTAGQLGNGTTTPSFTPTPTSDGLEYQEVVVGDDFSCGRANDGVTYCWGANDVGQLGTGLPGSSAVPVAVAGNPQFVSIAAAGRTACGVPSDGHLLCWGNGADGELGSGSFDVISSTPSPVATDLQLFAVAVGANAAGRATVCASSVTDIYCWGKNDDGEIGDGTRERRNVPTLVQGALGSAQVEPGGSHTCARTPQARVYCWGKGGRLGTGSDSGSLVPVPVAGDLQMAAITAGRDHTCGRTEGEPSVGYCWGLNTHGQLGDGTTRNRPAPVRIAEGT